MTIRGKVVGWAAIDSDEQAWGGEIWNKKDATAKVRYFQRTFGRLYGPYRLAAVVLPSKPRTRRAR